MICLGSVKSNTKLFIFSWSKLLNYISIDDAQLYQHDKLKDKERTALKEKFAVGIYGIHINYMSHFGKRFFFQGFNKEVEEIGKVQRGYSIPDVHLRESLKRDNKEYIIPKYNAFFNT